MAMLPRPDYEEVCAEISQAILVFVALLTARGGVDAAVDIGVRRSAPHRTESVALVALATVHRSCSSARTSHGGRVKGSMHSQCQHKQARTWS